MWRPTRAEVEAVNRMLYEELQAIRDRLNDLLDEGDDEAGAMGDKPEPTEDP